MEIISRDTYINHIMRYVDKGMIIAPKDYDGITHLSLRQMLMADSF